MTPTISTTFTYRTVAFAGHGCPKADIVERSDAPPQRRRSILRRCHRLLCDYLEACLLAAVSWVVSFLVTGLIQCATMLCAKHELLAHLRLP